MKKGDKIIVIKASSPTKPDDPCYNESISNIVGLTGEIVDLTGPHYISILLDRDKDAGKTEEKHWWPVLAEEIQGEE